MFQRVFIACLLMLFNLSLFAQEPDSLPDSRQIITRAIDFHDKGNYKEAIALYQKIPKSDTNYVWALYEMSLSYSADSQLNQALETCKMALDEESDREREPDLYNQYASLIDDSGDPDRAVRLYDSAIAKYPAFASLYLNKGTTLLRQGKYSEAEPVLQKGLLIDPYTASLHYMLALSAVNQGKIIPAFLSLLGYLTISPEGRHANHSINLLSTICRNKDELAPILKDRKSPPPAAYQLVEQIVLAKLALDPNYKPIIKLDDPISRQIQVVLEKLEFDESNPDFWMQYYVPLFHQVFESRQFEPFVNYIFSGVDLESINNYNKKNKKERQQLVDDIVSYLNDIKFSRVLTYNGRKNAPERYLFENGKLSGKGRLSADGSQALGDWIFYYPPGNRKAAGHFNEQGERTGKWSYYNFNGTLQAEEEYKNGKVDGQVHFFAYNGVLTTEAQYANDLKNGLRKVYFLTGAPSYFEQYKDDKLEGERLSFFNNGNLQEKALYHNDSLTGAYRTFFQDGSTDVQTQYINGQLSGPVKAFQKNGKLSYTGQYENNKKTGEWKQYHPNGKLKSISHYADDLLDGEYQEYYDNDTLFYQCQYKKGKIAGKVTYFDEDGLPFSTLSFAKDRLEEAEYFDKKGKLLSSSSLKKNRISMRIFRPNGTLRSTCDYDENGNATGTESYYFNSGKLSQTNEYINGQQNGPSIDYYPNGKKSSMVKFENGKRNGYFENWYIHGGKKSEGWYVDGQAQGTWVYYNDFGNPTSKTYYYNDDEHGYRDEFWPNGKRHTETLLQYGWYKTIRQFDSTGKLINTVDLHTGTGDFILLNINGKLYARGRYEKGSMNGPYTVFFFDGSTETSMFYKHGLLDSTYRDYFYGGQVHTEGQFHYGDRTGTWKYYNEKGKLVLTENYENGELNGKRTYYYDNGQINNEAEMKNGDKEGVMKQFTAQGELMYQVRFDDDLPVSYAYPGKDGKLVAPIDLPGATGKVTAYFPNGKKSAEFEYADGKVVGDDIEYNAEGKVVHKSTEYFGLSEGLTVTNFPNGQVKEDFQYRHDDLYGPYHKYDEQGRLLEQGQFVDGYLHGDITYYEATGKIKAVYHYYYGKLLSISK